MLVEIDGEHRVLPVGAEVGTFGLRDAIGKYSCLHHCTLNLKTAIEDVFLHVLSVISCESVEPWTKDMACSCDEQNATLPL